MHVPKSVTDMFVTSCINKIPETRIMQLPHLRISLYSVHKSDDNQLFVTQKPYKIPQFNTSLPMD
jgi:hypothetical protein